MHRLITMIELNEVLRLWREGLHEEAARRTALDEQARDWIWSYFGEVF